jgi:hypothetical protein
MENKMANLPFSQVLEQEIQEWSKFRRALRKEDQQVFDQLFEKVNQASCGSWNHCIKAMAI